MACSPPLQKGRPMTKRELLQKALDELESVLCSPDGYASIQGSAADNAVIDSVLTTFRTELAKPEPEPVAWMVEPIKGVAHRNMVRELSFYEPIAKADWTKVPLYRKEGV